MPGAVTPVVAHVVNRLEGGGTERVLMELLRRFDHRRCRHVVIPLRSAGPPACALPDEVAIRPLSCRAADRWLWLRLGRVLRQLGADIVHARNTSCWLDAALAAPLAGAATLLGFHGYDEGTTFRGRHAARVRICAATGATFTSVSEEGRERIIRVTKVAPQRVIVLRNGVDAVRFRPPRSGERHEIRKALDLPPDALVIGAVGSLVAVKRFDRLLRAFAAANLPGAILAIAGAGPEEPVIRELAAGLGLLDRVRLLGLRRDVERVMRAFDLFVCSSDAEGASNAVLEAMATGCAVISTRVGDHPFMLEEGAAGRLVPALGEAGDERATVEGLSAALRELGGDAGCRRHLGDRARRAVRNADLKVVTRTYEDVYATLLTGRDRPAGHAVTSGNDRKAVGMAGARSRKKRDGVLLSRQLSTRPKNKVV